MTPCLLVLLCLSVFSVSADNTPCICTMIYSPVCAESNNHFDTFSNGCMANCAGYNIAYAGQCLPENSNSPNCIENCEHSDKYVCGQKGDVVRSIPNKCVAQCQGFNVVKNGTCNNERILGFRDWFRKAKTAVSEGINTIKEKVHDIGEKIDDKIDDAKKAIKDAKDHVVEKAKDVANTIKEKAKDVVDTVKEKAHEAGEKIKDAAHTVANKTKEIAGKVKNKTKHWANKTKEAFKNLANRISNRVRKIKEGIENCTCHIVDRTKEAAKQLIVDIENKAKETAEKIKNGTIKAWNATKTAVHKAWDQTRDGVIKVGQFLIGIAVITAEKIRDGVVLIWGDIENAFRRTKRWFKNLLGCGCNREYVPVCIKADNGKQATMLNKCYADCGELEVLSTGECKGERNDRGIVIDI